MHVKDITQGQFLSSLTGLNSVFLLIDWLPYQVQRASSTLLFTHSWREDNWILNFVRALTLCKMQMVSSSIWIWVVISISYDNYYTTCVYIGEVHMVLDCNIVVRVQTWVMLVFKLDSLWTCTFEKDINLLILPTMG